MGDPTPGDLVALVADSHMRSALTALLARTRALGIRRIEARIDVHTQRDPGVYRGAHEHLRYHQDAYSHALALFDREGCGDEERGVADLEAIVQTRLDGSGWQGRSAVVAIHPELEAWVWGERGAVARAIGVPRADLLEVLSDVPVGEDGKPNRPKEALEEALRRRRARVSTAVFEQIGAQVGFRNCRDRSFLRLQDILRAWFPPDPSSP